MSENKEKLIPEQLLEAAKGGISVTPFKGEAVEDLEQQKCPYCKQPITFLNERSLYAGSGTTLKYFMCAGCIKVYKQIIYRYGCPGSDWGEVND